MSTMAMERESLSEEYASYAAPSMDEQTIRCLRMYKEMLQVLISDLRGEPVGVCLMARYKEDGQELLRRQARDYLHSGSTESGSYLWVCEVLGIDPAYIRKAEITGDILLWEKRCGDTNSAEYYLVRG